VKGSSMIDGDGEITTRASTISTSDPPLSRSGNLASSITGSFPTLTTTLLIFAWKTANLDDLVWQRCQKAPVLGR
jgi:hypothetical protein